MHKLVALDLFSEDSLKRHSSKELLIFSTRKIQDVIILASLLKASDMHSKRILRLKFASQHTVL